MTGTARDFAASGVVTLTTDFGLKDPFVGVVKGRLVEGFPAVRIIDLTHEIPAHWPAEAGFWLSRSFRYFPVGTVHVAVVDPGVGSARAIAVVEAEGHLFLAPDNGLLAPVVESASVACARHVSGDALLRLGVDAPSATFHGRDVFAHLEAPVRDGPRADRLRGHRRRSQGQRGGPQGVARGLSAGTPGLRPGDVAVVTESPFDEA